MGELLCNPSLMTGDICWQILTSHHFNFPLILALETGCTMINSYNVLSSFWCQYFNNLKPATMHMHACMHVHIHTYTLATTVATNDQASYAVYSS